jgi:hypothetical protein
MYAKIAAEIDKNTSNSALQLIKQEADTPLRCAQAKLVVRQHQGYDDSLLIKIMEQQASLASFAVNSDSDYAQDTINDLKAKMEQVQSRSKPIDDEIPAPPPDPILAYPSGLIVGSETDTTLTFSWNAVSAADSYRLYIDGVEVYSGGALYFQVTGLNPLTKYAANVSARNSSSTSPLSPTVIGVTVDTTP